MMNQVPTIFIGIGGIGMQIAATISDKINANARDYVGFFGIDTDIKSINKRRKENHHYMNYIQISEEWRVDDFLKENPELNEWFPQDPILKLRYVQTGAGQIRSLSRLAFISAEQKNKFQPIFDEINRIRKIGSNADKNLVVVIVGSITGGTGAGMFIQLPFLIRSKLLENCGIDTCSIRGMFVGPDITESAQHKPFMKHSICVNGYTCLKELNAFNLHHSKERENLPDEIRQSLRLENYKHDDFSPSNIPYDYIYLYENTTNIGTPGDISVDGMVRYISQIAYALLFTPVLDDAVSVEDNLIGESISKNNMNRYVGAGICRLCYPKEEAMEYVALSMVNSLVKTEWRVIDESYYRKYDSALERHKKDLSYPLPSRGKEYIDFFNKEMRNSTGKLDPKYSEGAYDMDKKNNQISKMEGFIKKVDKSITDIMISDQVKNFEEACRVNDKRMKSFDTAIPEVDRVWFAMKENVKTINNIRTSKPSTIADDFFPGSKKNMLLQKDSTDCIYGLLASVHPITARFLIYDAIDRLEKKIQACNKNISAVNLSGYLMEDFDKKKRDNQTPADALSNLKSEFNPLWNYMGFIGRYKEERSIRRLKKQLRTTVDNHISVGHSYLENSIKSEVYQILINRLTDLASAYEEFFDTIPYNIEKNEADIMNVKNVYFPYGEFGIYSKPDDFERMAERFIHDKQSDMTLPENTKASIFEELFTISLTDYSDISDGIAQSTDEIEAMDKEYSEKINKVFENSVISTVRSYVIKNGNGIVNLTARQALKEEYIYHKTDKNQKLNDYVKNKMEEAMRIATPMLTTTTTTLSDHLVFLATNSSNASKAKETDELPDLDLTRKDWFMSKDDHIVIDNEFSDCELSIVKIAYGYMLDDLVKYAPDSHNEKEYKKRISNLSNNIIVNPQYDINPHLNRYWQEAAFTPSIQFEQRQKDGKDLIKAFVLGLAFDYFIKVPQGDKKDRSGNPILRWVADVEGTMHPIMKCDKQIGQDFAELYYSLLYNGVVKDYILSKTKENLEAYKFDKTREAIARRVLREPFVLDLVANDKGDEKKGECNIFDIFLSMYSRMPKAEWKNLVFGFRDVLWEIFDDLFDGDETLINRKTHDVLTLVYDHSSVSKKKKKGEKETVLHRYYEVMLSSEFV